MYSACVKHHNLLQFSCLFSSAKRVHQYRVWVAMLHTLEKDEETDTFRLKQIIVHQNYNPSTYENDIALLELRGSVKGQCSPEHTIPACVPWSEYMFKTGHTCKISGWGVDKGICFSAYCKV